MKVNAGRRLPDILSLPDELDPHYGAQRTTDALRQECSKAADISGSPLTGKASGT